MILEELKEKIFTAVENGSDEFPDHLLNYVSTAFRIPVQWIEKANWELVVHSFYAILLKSPIVKLPLTSPSSDTASPDDWDYEGRSWHRYTHLLSNAYGWTIEYISQLQVVEALAKIQEILTERQLDREFHHHLSEVAYAYDKNTKKSNYVPLDRPHWMRKKIKDVPRFKMPVSILPVGAVDYSALPEELRPQTT